MVGETCPHGFGSSSTLSSPKVSPCACKNVRMYPQSPWEEKEGVFSGFHLDIDNGAGEFEHEPRCHHDEHCLCLPSLPNLSAGEIWFCFLFSLLDSPNFLDPQLLTPPLNSSSDLSGSLPLFLFSFFLLYLPCPFVSSLLLPIYHSLLLPAASFILLCASGLNCFIGSVRLVLDLFFNIYIFFFFAALDSPGWLRMIPDCLIEYTM